MLALPSNAAATPVLTTDKADYSPGETVHVTGAWFDPLTAYAIPVMRPDGTVVQIDPITHQPIPGWAVVTSDAAGNLSYDYLLNGIKGLYEVRTYPAIWAGDWSQAPIASVTFTDFPIPNNVSMVTWRTQPSGAWIQGTLQGNNSDFSEGETVPFRIELGTLSLANNPYTVAICRDYQLANGVFGYTTLMPFNTSRAADPGGTITSFSGAFTGVNLNISSIAETGGSGACGSTQRETIVTFSVLASGPQFLLWGGRLASPNDPGVGDAKSASFWTGGSLQMRLQQPDKTSGIQPSAIVRLAKITVQKVVDSGSATPDQWCFNISPNPSNETLPKCPASGADTVTFLGLPSGSYQVTETTTVAGYQFASGSGTSCSFSGSTATASVTASQNPNSVVNAACTFHNRQSAGTLTIEKICQPAGDTGSFNLRVDGTTIGTAAACGGSRSTQVNSGAHTVSETGAGTTVLSDYVTTIGGDCAADGSVSVPAAGSKTCTITNVRRGSITVTKQIEPASDLGRFDLRVDSTVVRDAAADNEGGTASGLAPNTYTVSELADAASPTGLADYVSSVACSGETTAQNATSLQVTVSAGENVTCTITNVRKAQLTVNKVCQPANDPGNFVLAVNPGNHTNAVGCGGSLGPVQLGPGGYTVSETAGLNTNLGDYVVTINGACAASGEITLAAGQSATCTITNVRRGSIAVTKQIEPASDLGRFDLKVDSTVVRDAAADNEGGTANGLAPASYTVSELADAASPTGLADYVSSVACSDETTAENATSLQVTVSAGENVTCTITNVRRGSIAVTKQIEPATDLGRFDLKVGATVVRDAAADNEGGTANGLAPASYTVSELADAASPTTLADYVSSVACSGETTAQNATSLLVTVSAGESVTCTVTNVRRGSIAVTKSLDPAADSGKFDLLVGADVVANEVGNGGSGTATGLAPASYTVSELAGSTSPTTLADYVSSVQCSGEGDAVSGTSLQVTVAAGESVTCTVTNVRRGSIAVTKSLDPAADSGKFDLLVGADVVANEVGNGGSGTATGLAPASYTVSELAGSTSPTTLADYVSSVQCSGEGDAVSGTSLQVTVAAGESVTCTVTNVRRGSIAVTKSLDPAADSGKFDLLVGADVVANEVGNGGSGTATGLAPASYTVSELAGSTSPTTLADYVSSVQCSGEGDAVSGTSLQVTVSAGENVTCTVTNVRRGSITVTKQIEPATDLGRFDLKVGATVVRDAAADNEGGTATGLAPDTYTVSELADAASPTGLGDYVSSVACSDETTAENATSLQVTVSAGENVTCTITNVRRGSIAVTKQIEPATDLGRFDLKVGATVVRDAAADNEGGTATGLAPDTYTVSELADAASPTGLGDYVSSVACSDETTAENATSLQVTVSAGENVTCTITNVRRGSIAVTKQIEPASDLGLFDLRVDSTVVRDAAADNEGGTATGLAPDTYTVSELADAASPTGLGDYVSSVACSDETTAENATSLQVTVSAGENVTCTITNVRRGSIAVTKQIEPATDLGRFDLKVGATVVRDAAADNEGGTATGLAPDTYTVSELADAASPTGLGDYVSSVACSDETTAENATSLQVTVSAGENVTCTITNVRRGSIAVTKQIEPATDLGRFDLKVGATVVRDAAADNEGGTATGLAPDTYTVSELADAASPTGLGDYVSSVACSDETTAENATSLQVTVSAGENVTCTITNVRKARLTVNKVCQPANDPGNFVLAVNPGNHTNAVGCGGSLGPVQLSPGGYTVSETAGLNTNLGDYVVTINGACASDGSVTLAAGQSATCTVTNVRRGSIRVTKSLDPVTDSGKFDLLVGADVVANEVGNGGNGTKSGLAPGNYTVSELAGSTSSTTLADYVSSVACSDETTAENATSLQVTVSAGENVTCTITNVRRGSITVTKQIEPATDLGRFDLKVDATVVRNAAADNQGGTATGLAPGSYTASELADEGSPTTLADYVSSVACSGETTAQNATSLQVTVSAGENVTCTITNVRKARLTVNKVCQPANDPGNFVLAVNPGSHTNAVGCGGSLGPVQLTPGSYTVSETAGLNTNLGDYVVTINGACAASGAITLAPGQVATCTVTNARKPKLTVTKLCPNGKQSTEDRFEVLLNGTRTGRILGVPVTCADSTTFIYNAPTTKTVSEAVPVGNTTTNLQNYVITIGGHCNSAGTVVLAFGDDKTCTITNTRRTRSQPLTPGFWKTHRSQTTALLPVLLGSYSVNTFAKATAVFDAMNCGASTDQSAAGCLAGHLLAAKLNVKNGSDNCINARIAEADTLLVSINYVGPTGTYVLTPSQRTQILVVKDALDRYANGLGCS